MLTRPIKVTAVEHRFGNCLIRHLRGCGKLVSYRDRQWLLGVIAQRDWIACLASPRRFCRTLWRLSGCPACTIVFRNSVRDHREAVRFSEERDLIAALT